MNTRDLSAHDVYVPGEGLTEVARELGRDPADLIALGSNENPHGPSPAAIDAIAEFSSAVHAYPKASHTDLQQAIADHWEVAPEQVWLAAGADGAIDYLSRAMLSPGDRMLVPQPGFSYYAMSGRYHHGTIDTYPVTRTTDFVATPETVLEPYDGQRMVYLTSPHNPTGSIVSIEQIETIAERTRDETLVVVDEAYGEFADIESARTLLDDREDIAVLRTFSKAYGLAGLRVGYGLVPAAWADAYARINTPFAVNELACRAARAALDDPDHVERTVSSARTARRRFRTEIDAPTWKSHGNFVLVEVGDATAVAEALKQRGVIVRDCTSFGLPGCIRISCGTESETTAAIEAVNDVLAAQSEP